METLMKNMETFFNNISKEDLEKLLIKNGYNEMKASSDFGYALKTSKIEQYSNIKQYSNNYNFLGLSKTKKYITNKKIGEAA